MATFQIGGMQINATLTTTVTFPEPTSKVVESYLIADGTDSEYGYTTFTILRIAGEEWPVSPPDSVFMTWIEAWNHALMYVDAARADLARKNKKNAQARAMLNQLVHQSNINP